MKVGGNLADDRRRLGALREVIGPNCQILIDANQVWEVDQAIDWVRACNEESFFVRHAYFLGGGSESL